MMNNSVQSRHHQLCFANAAYDESTFERESAPFEITSFCRSKASFFQSPTLSLSAKGIYLWLHGTQITSFKAMRAALPEKEQKLRSCLAELRQEGFVKWDGQDLIELIQQEQ